MTPKLINKASKYTEIKRADQTASSFIILKSAIYFTSDALRIFNCGLLLFIPAIPVIVFTPVGIVSPQNAEYLDTNDSIVASPSLIVFVV